ncbi:MAG: hypothetical protein WAK48_21710 [Candidatus Acidiferrum sp.]
MSSVPGYHQAARARSVRHGALQGDSRGWLETAANEWCGVLVAVDNLMGYALEAEDTLVQANKVFGTKLQLA